ncbi:MAG: glycosyltransferase family 2 protein, partial [Alphaproteobacteria bacterium]|nr:glycosyltransferase family 2 protein [Alphaproteobacteria bacterium]
MTSSASTPVVSVLLPVYNGRATLRESVQSILQQTFRDFELLIIDDGSTDDSATLANNFHDARVRVLGDATRRGLAARLNEGIEAARGRYIARMDADDLAFSFRLERQVQFLDACPDIDLVGCRALVFREGGQVTGLLPFAASHAAICARPWSGFYLAHP